MPSHAIAPRRAARVLADGQWHPLRVLIVELTKLVPPGKATRTYANAGRNPNVPLEMKVEIGARARVVNDLRKWVRHGWLEYDPPLPPRVDWSADYKVRATDKLLALVPQEERLL